MPDRQSVLVTRPEPAAEAFADQLRSIPDVDVFKAPMTVVSAVTPPGALPSADALLFTSPRGVEHADALPALPAYAVGETTARAAREAGLEVHGIAAGQADQSLTELVPRGTTLLHLSGAHLSRDLAGAFAKRDVTLIRRVVYEAKAVVGWPLPVHEFLASPGTKSVTFLSARAAKIFAGLAPDGQARAELQQTRALCASARIAEVAKGANLFSSVKNLAAPDPTHFVDFVSSGCT